MREAEPVNMQSGRQGENRSRIGGPQRKVPENSQKQRHLREVSKQQV